MFHSRQNEHQSSLKHSRLKLEQAIHAFPKLDWVWMAYIAGYNVEQSR